MIRVFPLNDRYADIFGKMFADYYDELGCDEDAEHLVREYVLPDLIAGLLRADMIEEDGVPCGSVRKPMPALADSDAAVVDEAAAMIAAAIAKYC